MPDLPTITVNQTHFDRIVAAFPGDTLQKKAAAYRAWLTGNLIDFVKKFESKALDAQLIIEAALRRAELEAALAASLPTRPPFPPVEPPPPPVIGEGSNDPDRP